MAYHQRKSTEQKIVEGILRGLWSLLTLPFRGIRKSQTKTAIDRIEIEQRWQSVVNLSNTSDPHQLSQSIIMADKLLDAVLVARNVQGQTLGERLKLARDLYADQNIYQALWEAHKLRNLIAHEVSHQINLQEGKAAIEKFKKGIFSLI